MLWESTGERGIHLGIPERLLGGGHTGADTESGIWSTDLGQLWVLPQAWLSVTLGKLHMGTEVSQMPAALGLEITAESGAARGGQDKKTQI